MSSTTGTNTYMPYTHRFCKNINSNIYCNGQCRNCPNIKIIYNTHASTSNELINIFIYKNGY